MEYNDEQILRVEDYEQMAKAYANALKSKGFLIVQIDEKANKELIEEIFEQFYAVKSLLFSLGGFLNTGNFYSLNDRQMKKFSILFDCDKNLKAIKAPYDKTKALLSFLSIECLLIKNLIKLADQTQFELQLKDIINARLSLLSQILGENPMTSNKR